MRKIHLGRKKRRCLLAVAVAGLLFSQLFVPATPVHATSIDDAKQEKEQAEDNKNKAESVLSDLENSRSEINSAIMELDNQLSDLQSQLSDLGQQKEDLEAKIADTQAQLEVAKAEENAQYVAMCERIRYMYENGDVDYVDLMLSAQNMSEMLNEPEYMTALAGYDYKMLEGLVEKRESIANTEVMLESDLKGVEEVTAEVENKKAQVDSIVDEKREKLSEYDDLIAQQQALIDQYDREMQAAASRIAQLEAAASNSGTFVPYQGGALVWPCPSSTRITSYFGYRTPDGGYVNANHKGIDIGASTGTPVVAAASGVVVIARYSNSAGNWIVISHGNGFYTIYMHSSQLLVTEGQSVNAGDTIMLVGSTGWSTGPHLHFGVGQGGYTSAYNVDPLSYFR